MRSHYSSQYHCDLKTSTLLWIMKVLGRARVADELYCIIPWEFRWIHRISNYLPKKGASFWHYVVKSCPKYLQKGHRLGHGILFIDKCSIGVQGLIFSERENQCARMRCFSGFIKWFSVATASSRSFVHRWFPSHFSCWMRVTTDGILSFFRRRMHPTYNTQENISLWLNEQERCLLIM